MRDFSLRRRGLWGGVFSIALLACSGDPVASQDPGTTALVGFRQEVDRGLLERAGAAVLEVFESPPAARVRAVESALARLEGEPAVAFVVPEMVDSVSAFVTFHDRPTVEDPVSRADRAAIAAVGGRIKYVYDIINDVAVVIPRWAVEPLRAQPAVKEVIPLEANVHPL